MGKVRTPISHKWYYSPAISCGTDADRCQGYSERGSIHEGCFALVEGDYTDEEKFTVIALGHPPCERRDIALCVEF